MSKGIPPGGVSFAAGAGGGATVVAPPVLPWICDWTGTGAAELAATWLAAATDVVAAAVLVADVAALVAGLEAAS
jgi:hypothetical protein